MDEQDLRKYVRLVLERASAPVTEREVLQMINRGPGGAMPVDELSPDEVEAAETLVMRGLLRRVPAGHGVSSANGRNVTSPVDRKVAHRYPERYVVTSGGSHATDTFKHDTLHDERPEIRRARRDGTLKTKQW